MNIQKIRKTSSSLEFFIPSSFQLIVAVEGSATAAWLKHFRFMPFALLRPIFGIAFLSSIFGIVISAIIIAISAAANIASETLNLFLLAGFIVGTIAIIIIFTPSFFLPFSN